MSSGKPPRDVLVLMKVIVSSISVPKNPHRAYLNFGGKQAVIITAFVVWIIMLLSTETKHVLIVVDFYTQIKITVGFHARVRQ